MATPRTRRTLWTASSVSLTLLLSCSDSRKPPSPRSRDAPTPTQLRVRWNPNLTDADRIRVAGGFVIGEWDAGPSPAPPEIRAFDIAAGTQVLRERGWLLHPGASPAEAVVVDELAKELTYGIRRLGRPAAEVIELPRPDDGTWPLRAAVCGNGAELCAVVRWAPLTEGKPSPDLVERIAVTVVDAGKLTVGKTFVVESTDRFSGNATIGGVTAHPTEPEIYLHEWDRKDRSATFVRAISLTDGSSRWRARLPRIDAHPDADDFLTVTSDGNYIVVARGETRFGLLALAEIAVIEMASGNLSTRSAAPASWQQVVLIPDVAQRSLMAVLANTSQLGLSESPTMGFAGVGRFNAETGSFAMLSGPVDEPVPQKGLALELDELLLVPPGNALAARDTTPVDQQLRRAEAIERLLGRE